MMTKTIVVGAKKVDVAKQEQRRSDRVRESGMSRMQKIHECWNGLGTLQQQQ
jgi:hypothetical protein